jgi:hypothetical protein
MKILVKVLVVLAILALGFVLWVGLPKGPSFEEVAHLAEPRLATKQPQRVLLVKARGDPNVVGGRAFGLLMRTYMKLEGVPKWGPGLPSPRARWPVGSEVPPDQWEGHYAIPVPDSITHLAEVGPGEGLDVELTTWEYGEVAEVLHVGAYDAEEPTIELLRAFVEEEGYEITGDHEEEYLRGPGMIFKGNPERYLTLLRYPVTKKSEGG